MSFDRRLNETLGELLAANIATVAATLEGLCESPIEVALGTALILFDRLEQSWQWGPLCVARQHEEWPANSRLLIPQFEVDAKRIDFMIRDGDAQLFVECDGHDFHERTKEQAARDRRRDREVQRAGVNVLRFTGSEIYRDPIRCASEIFDFLSALHTPKRAGGLG